MKLDVVIVGIKLCLLRGFDKVAHSDLSEYNVGMDKLKELIKQMEDEMRADLKKSGDLEEYGEEGIRIAVYEDLKDSLKHLFSDILYK